MRPDYHGFATGVQIVLGINLTPTEMVGAIRELIRDFHVAEPGLVAHDAYAACVLGSVSDPRD